MTEPESSNTSERYFKPTKRIQSAADVDVFQRTTTYSAIVSFIVDVGKAISGKRVKHTDEIDNIPESVLKTCEMLNAIQSWLKDIPPVKQPMRFGNIAFRTFREKLDENVDSILTKMLPEALHPSIIELKMYLCESFGNDTRIDYGTGHECNFVAFLICLFKLNFFRVEDREHVAMVIFKLYIDVMREIQSLYGLEPAGSRGVWGLDDYHFLPFYWGAAQLQDQKELTPHDTTDRQTVLEQKDANLYFNAIHVILTVKKGVPFGECAPLLNDISAVPTWSKVTSGLLKMYEAEVLTKFPVIQHFFFGSILPFE